MRAHMLVCAPLSSNKSPQAPNTQIGALIGTQVFRNKVPKSKAPQHHRCHRLGLSVVGEFVEDWVEGVQVWVKVVKPLVRDRACVRACVRPRSVAGGGKTAV